MNSTRQPLADVHNILKSPTVFGKSKKVGGLKSKGKCKQLPSKEVVNVIGSYLDEIYCIVQSSISSNSFEAVSAIPSLVEKVNSLLNRSYNLSAESASCSTNDLSLMTKVNLLDGDKKNALSDLLTLRDTSSASSIFNNFDAFSGVFEQENDYILANCQSMPDDERQTDDDAIALTGYDDGFMTEGIMHWDMICPDIRTQKLLSNKEDITIAENKAVKVVKSKRKNGVHRASNRRKSGVCKLPLPDEPNGAAVKGAVIPSELNKIQDHAEEHIFSPEMGAVLHWNSSFDIDINQQDKILSNTSNFGHESIKSAPLMLDMLHYDHAVSRNPGDFSSNIEFPTAIIEDGNDLKIENDSTPINTGRSRSRRRASLSAESFIHSVAVASQRSTGANSLLSSTVLNFGIANVEDGAEKLYDVESTGMLHSSDKGIISVTSVIESKSTNINVRKRKLNPSREPTKILLDSLDDVVVLAQSTTEYNSSVKPNIDINHLSVNELESILKRSLRLLPTNWSTQLTNENRYNAIEKAQRLFESHNLYSSSTQLHLIDESTVLCMLVAAVLLDVSESNTIILLQNILTIFSSPCLGGDDVISRYIDIESKLPHSKPLSVSLSNVTKPTSDSVGGPQKPRKVKCVRFNKMDGSNIDPPNDRQPMTWVSLLLAAKRFGMISAAVSGIVSRSSDQVNVIVGDEVLTLVSVLHAFTSSTTFCRDITDVVRQHNTRLLEVSHISSGELKSLSELLLPEIIAHVCGASGLDSSLRQRTAWMVSAVVRYQLRWSLDLPPPCVSVPSATGDIYSTFRSELCNYFDIIPPLEVKNKHSKSLHLKALQFADTHRTHKAREYLDSVIHAFSAQPFANMSYLFTAALRQISNLLQLISTLSRKEGNLHMSPFGVDYITHIKTNDGETSNLLKAAVDKEKDQAKIDFYQTILGAEAAASFLINIFECLPELSSCTYANSIHVESNAIHFGQPNNRESNNNVQSPVVIDIIKDAIGTLRGVSQHNFPVSIPLNTSEDKHLLLLEEGFTSLQLALNTRVNSAQYPSVCTHLLSEKIVSWGCDKLKVEFEQRSRLKMSSAADVYPTVILLFPTIVRRLPNS